MSVLLKLTDVSAGSRAFLYIKREEGREHQQKLKYIKKIILGQLIFLFSADVMLGLKK